MSAPHLAPYPPPGLQQKIVPSDWELCVNSWLLLTRQYLLLPRATFEIQVVDGSSLVNFFTSYVASTSAANKMTLAPSSSLRENTFLLIFRAFKEVATLPATLLDWQFLSSLSVVFQKSQSLRNILPVVWEQHLLGDTASFRKSKLEFTSILEPKHSGPLLEDRIAKEMAFARACYPYAQFLMVGTDLLDSLVSTFEGINLSTPRKYLAALIFVCSTSLMNEQKPQTSALLDLLYSHKSTNVVKTLIESTPFLLKFKNHISKHQELSGRAAPLLKDFATLRQKSRSKSKSEHSHLSNIARGKRKAEQSKGQDSLGDVHVHKLSLVTQIQDLFPDLGSGFIIKLLDEYNDNTEEITAHLLDDNLPPSLKEADRSEEFDFSNVPDLAHNTSPPHSPLLLPNRRNIFDNDELDNLTVDASKLHLGRKNKDLTADIMLSSQPASHQKAAILSALAAFDSDDDERDDTYDAEDVGGTVDTTFAGDGADNKTDQNDQILFSAYKTTPELFNRDWNTRRGQPRAALKHETGMTDEAIEGWGIMLSRDPRRLKYLERLYERMNVPHQRTLEATSWKQESGPKEGEEGNVVGSQESKDGQDERIGRGGRGGFGGRGGRGRGGVAGPASERETQVARQRKDANKGSRANHNRRDQRARRMARGGFPG